MGGETQKKKSICCRLCLEDRNLRQNAEVKLKEKNLDMIIANTSAAIGSDKSTVQIKTPDCKWLKLPMTAKNTIAAKIIRKIESILG
jgi:phosphopantothenoylcysteine synthetase/decarboxylase